MCLRFNTRRFFHFQQAPKLDLKETASARKIKLSFPQASAGGEDACRSYGTRLVNMQMMANLISQMACPKCFTVGCKFVETKRIGLSSVVSISCLNNNCQHNISTRTSPVVGVGKKKTSEVNLLVVASGRNCGIGYNKTHKFLAGLDVPQPLHLTTYQSVAKKVHSAAIIAAQASMSRAGEVIRRLQNLPSGQQYTPVVVSYDGTWHKRGHSSHHGIGIVIDLSTGFVLDYKVLSNYCHGCMIGPKPKDKGYQAWHSKHKPKCQKNYSGSANSMEVGAAKIMFSRSRQIQQLEYTTVLCDGDAKTIQALNDANIYATTITKEDCVNHVAKRMWKAIETTKQAAKGTSKPLTGRGRLTREVQDKLAGYYAQALKTYAPDVEAMKRGVYASLFHMVSTDSDPHHTSCPTGPTSWCFYNRAQALQEVPRPHTPTMRRDIAEALLHVYERLSNAALLERCSRMRTQNANECFNAQVWRRCPKTEPTSLRTVETAAAMAVLEFNNGPQGFHALLTELGITPGVHQVDRAQKAEKQRLKRASASMTDAAVLKRRRKKTGRAKEQDQQEANEGVLYSAGQFNL